MAKERAEEGWYVMCSYKKGAFSSERIVEFFALGAGERLDFIPEKQRGGVLGYVENILITNEDGSHSHLKENSTEGEGLMKCRYIENLNGGKVHIGISNQHGHRISRFVVPKDSIKYISPGEIRSNQSPQPP